MDAWLDNPDTPRVHPIEPGTVRFRQLLGAAWSPAMIGVTCLVIMFASALYGQWKSLYGIPLWLAWHELCVLMYRRDPQYWDIIWDCEWTYPWPCERRRECTENRRVCRAFAPERTNVRHKENQ